MNLGERLSKLRRKKKITQKILADKLFVADKTISSWETGRTEPGLEMLIKLSEILDCSVGYLIYGESTKNNIETEIKIKITEKEYKTLLRFMKETAKFLKENNHIDTYYQPIKKK